MMLASQTPPDSLPGLLDGYRLTARYGQADELLQGDGSLKEEYAYVYESFGALGAAGLAARRGTADAMLRANGVSYNAGSRLREYARNWQLDLFPLLLSSAEWTVLERGLLQRAELIRRVLADIYGARDSVVAGVLPGELLWENPAFLRICQGLPAMQDPVSFLAMDIVRTPRGFLVLNDRLQSPSGAGYALENRLVMSRVFPSLYRDSQVHRLANFFREWKKSWDRVAVQPGEMVCLTPGPYSETYFEQAFLAGYLGMPLTAGQDLTTHGGRVYRKSVDGMQPVRGIYRRVEDGWLDPLELRPESVLGVTGMLEAVRSGAVKLFNLPGCGVLEDRAVFSRLPDLSRYFLGEELLLPQVETHWMGGNGRDSVLHRLEEFAFKPLLRDAARPTVYGDRLQGRDSERLRRRLARDGRRWIAQKIEPGSVCPLFDGERFIAGRCVLRVFIAAGPGGLHVMPGGLARVNRGLDEMVVSSGRGAISKDVWIIASEPVREVTLLSNTPPPPPETHSTPAAVSSSHAESLYWFGRYLSRAQATLHLLDRANGIDPDNPLHTELARLLGEQLGIPSAGGDSAARLRAIIGSEAPGSFRHSRQALLRNAQLLRDELPAAARRCLALLQEGIGPENDFVGSVPQQVVLSAIAGETARFMKRGPAWVFLRAGVLVEGLVFALRLNDSLTVLANPVVGLAAWVTGADLGDAPREDGQEDQDPARAFMRYGVLDRDNPQSAACLLDELCALAERTPGWREDTQLAQGLEALRSSFHLLRMREEGAVNLSADALSALAAGLCALAERVHPEIQRRHFLRLHEVVHLRQNSGNAAEVRG